MILSFMKAFIKLTLSPQNVSGLQCMSNPQAPGMGVPQLSITEPGQWGDFSPVRQDMSPLSVARPPGEFVTPATLCMFCPPSVSLWY